MAGEGRNQYPNSNPEGLPLPFDVGDLYGTARLAIAATATATALEITNPSGFILIAVFFAVDARALVSLDGTDPTLTDGEFQESVLVVPKNGINKVLLPSDAEIKCISEDGSTTGRLLINIYRAWKSGGIDALKQSM